MTQSEKATCWIVTEGMAGTENQCLGLADMLGVKPIVKRIKLNSPWSLFSPTLKCGLNMAYSGDGDSLNAPYPDILITSGRKSIVAALMIKKKSQGRTITINIQDPRIDPKYFDYVVVPQHDPTRGENVIVTTGALHRVTTELTTEHAEKFKNRLSHLPDIKIAVMIGGSSKSHQMTANITRKLCQDLKKLSHENNYGLMVTASRRTGEENSDILQKELGQLDNVYYWDGQGDNPYFSFLGLADFILVTEDSVSMTSEAISTGKPVYSIPLEGGAKRLDKFHALLKKQGYTRLFSGQLEKYTYEAPQDTKSVAEQIIKDHQGLI